MAFTAGEIASIANASLDYYFNKGGQFDQTIQEKPLLNLWRAARRPSPAARATSRSPSSARTATAPATTSSRATPTTTPSASSRRPTSSGPTSPWREHHIGLTLTHTELKIDGICVVDTNGEKTAEHSKRELTVLVNLLEQKLFSLGRAVCAHDEHLLCGRRHRRRQGAGGHARRSSRTTPASAPSAASTRPRPPDSRGGATARTPRRWRRKSARSPGDAISGGGPITSNPANGGALLAGAAARILPAHPLRRQADDRARGLGVHRRADDRAPGERLLHHDRLLASRRTSRRATSSCPGGTKVQYDPDARRLGLSRRGSTGSTRSASS